MTYQPIACHIYDYLEIACMRGYTLDIVLQTGETLSGIAKNTLIRDKKEYLLVQMGQQLEGVRLDKIDSITPLDKKADFKTIKIS